MAFPQRFLDELVDRSDIVDVVSSYVSLSKKGGNYFGLCPFHNEKTGSFSVAPDKQIYYCFGCHHGGGVIHFIMEIENLDFPDAVRFLAKRANMDVPEDNTGLEESRRRQRVLAVNRDAARWFYSNLSRPEGAAVAAYLEKRKISRKTAMDFGLGASPDSWDALLTAMGEKGYTKADLLAAGLAVSNQKGRIYDKFRNRLMFPVIDVKGDVVAFGGRVLDKSEPKYMNTTETMVYSKRRNLYGINLAKKTKRPNFILCEGNIDVITLHQAGFDNTVATMGTALTEDHVRLLERYTKELVLCYDNDAAGEDATQRSIALLKNSEVAVKVLRLPKKQLPDGTQGKQDADDYIKNFGPGAFEGLMDRSANSAEYRLGVVRGQFDLSRDDQRAAYLQAAAEVIASLPSPVERDIYAGRCAEEARVSKEAVVQEADRLRGKRRRQAQKQEERQNLAPARQLQPKSRELRYANVRSARAEEGVLRVVVLDPELFRELDGLEPEQFSAPHLGKAYDLLRRRWREGRSVSLAALEGQLAPEELDGLSAVIQQPQARNTAREALEDCKQTILVESRRGDIHSAEDLNGLQQALKQKKAYGG